jgi:hypothetical protein
MTIDFSDMASQDRNGKSRTRTLSYIPEGDEESEGEVEDYESDDEKRRKLPHMSENDEDSEGGVEDYRSEGEVFPEDIRIDDQEEDVHPGENIAGTSVDDGWITHDANEYIVVHAWQGQMQNTSIDIRVYNLEFRYYLKDGSVWFILNGGKRTKNVDMFPKDAYQTAIKRWEESRANYIVREQKIKFVNYTDNALIEEVREYDVDGSRQLYYFDGRLWIYKQTLPKSKTEESKTEGANAVHKRPALWKRVVDSLGGNRNNTKKLLMDLEALGKSID